jgi:hypothetical protein
MSADAAARMDSVNPEWPATAGQWFRFAGNLVNLTTLLGLAIAKLGRATIRRGPRGLFLCEGYKLKFPVAGAFTVGNVITTGSTWEAMLARWPQLLQHEERHTWHYIACLGMPFYPAYAICMGWSMLRTGDRAARELLRAGRRFGDGRIRRPPDPAGRGQRQGDDRPDQSIVRSIPSRLAERIRCRLARNRRSRLTSSGSWASASGLSINAFSTW